MKTQQIQNSFPGPKSHRTFEKQAPGRKDLFIYIGLFYLDLFIYIGLAGCGIRESV